MPPVRSATSSATRRTASAKRKGRRAVKRPVAAPSEGHAPAAPRTAMAGAFRRGSRAPRRMETTTYRPAAPAARLPSTGAMGVALNQARRATALFHPAAAAKTTPTARRRRVAGVPTSVHRKARAGSASTTVNLASSTAARLLTHRTPAARTRVVHLVRARTRAVTREATSRRRWTTSKSGRLSSGSLRRPLTACLILKESLLRPSGSSDKCNAS